MLILRSKFNNNDKKVPIAGTSAGMAILGDFEKIEITDEIGAICFGFWAVNFQPMDDAARAW